MDSAVRTARPGDICILLEPAQDEIPSLRERQLTLQARFGGHPHETIHLTCQRFDPQGRLMPHVIEHVRTAFAIIQPFPIIAVSLVQFYSPFWETRLLRWRVLGADALPHCQAMVENMLTGLGITPHYPSDRTALVTALEGVPEVNLDQHLRGMIFPHHLFVVREVVLSRIKGAREFDVLDRRVL